MTGAAPNKQQLRSQRSTNALLEAAGELIAEGGFEALTFSAVGERAGYSRGLAAVRFGSKDGLIEALIDRIVGGWSHRNVIPLTRNKTGLEAITILIDAIAAQAAKDSKALMVLYALMFEATGSDDDLRRRFAKFHEGFRSDVARFVTRGQRDGSIRADAAADAEGTLVVSALRGIGYQWLLDPGGFDPMPAFDYLSETTAARLRS